MKIIKSYVTKSDCYKTGRKIKVRGLMLHSVGCNQPNASVFINTWNKPGWNVCPQAVIDAKTGDIYQTLPWNHRGWHGGGSSNDTHIGVEMCESSTIKYKGGATWVETGDGSETKAAVTRTYNSAVQLFAHLCEEFDLNPLEDGVIISHYEGGKRGVASGHADPEHIWKKYGYTMDKFRKDVKAAMGKTSSTTSKPATAPTVKTESASNTADVLYKVQVGAFSSKSNAEAQLKKVKAEGFDAIIVSTKQNSSASTAKPTIKVGSTVKLKKGAKTYTGGSLASFVYNRTYKVSQIDGDRAVIKYDGAVVAAVKTSDLTLM